MNSISPVSTEAKAEPGPGATGMQQALRRSAWLKTLHQWHWISSALCLLGMLLFALTGITLNHASQIEAKPKISKRQAQLPPILLQQLRAPGAAQKKSPLPPQVAAWCEQNLNIDTRLHAIPVEWSADEAYLPLPRPGGDAWLRIALEDGQIEYELTERGAIAWLNDLHKGRHTGSAWNWFIDIFAVACLIFCITGFLILKYHAQNRPSTWPVLGLGVLIPALLAILLIH